jgi:hypothetical protein
LQFVATYVVHGEHILGNRSVEYVSIDQEGFDLNAIQTVDSNVSRSINQLPKVSLAIFDGPETNQMSPILHLGPQ